MKKTRRVKYLYLPDAGGFQGRLGFNMLSAPVMSATIQARDTERKEGEEEFVFTAVKENPIASVRDRNHTVHTGAIPSMVPVVIAFTRTPRRYCLF